MEEESHIALVQRELNLSSTFISHDSFPDAHDEHTLGGNRSKVTRNAPRRSWKTLSSVRDCIIKCDVHFPKIVPSIGFNQCFTRRNQILKSNGAKRKAEQHWKQVESIRERAGRNEKSYSSKSWKFFRSSSYIVLGPMNGTQGNRELSKWAHLLWFKQTWTRWIWSGSTREAHSIRFLSRTCPKQSKD
jgi:hypothetical protein